MKYKIGDKVKIREDLSPEANNTLKFRYRITSDMAKLAGKICTISRCNGANSYVLEEDEDDYWSDDMFEDIININDELQVLREKYEELGKEIKRLEEKNKIKRWRAKKDEKYYVIKQNGDISWLIEANDSTDYKMYRNGNYFKSESKAKEAIEKIKIYTELQDIAIELNNGNEINWKDLNQSKYYIILNKKENRISQTTTWQISDMCGIYCLDSDFLRIAKARIGEDRLKKLFED